MTNWWAAGAWVDGAFVRDVRIVADASGTIAATAAGVPPEADDIVLEGIVHPGAVNAHSHAFHRLLRGRTHGDGGSFWTWRELMYREAGRLDPSTYEMVATAVYAEMVTAGWTSVAEFHYVHHQPGGSPYAEPHAMEKALARAAVAAGIRLTLLDTCYLAGGFGTPLSDEQRRFGDGSAGSWLARLASLRTTIGAEFPEDAVTVGAALHSVRAVPFTDLAEIAAGIDPVIPLHVHLSEQPAENEACLAATGKTPTALLAERGLLSARTSAVHATHLTEHDIHLLGTSGSTVVMCPTTEADLGDGIGPARALADAGATIALGTDQHAVVDPLLETRALEHGERLGSGRRGRFSPDELIIMSSAGGAASVSRDVGSLSVGQPCDFIVVDPASVRTVGSNPSQLMLSASAADVMAVVISARVVAEHGIHKTLGAPAPLLRMGMEALG
jgi:formiminoglutamate deiminase